MSDETTGRRSRQRRAGFLAVALAGTALLAAGCSDPKEKAGGTNGQGGEKSKYEQGVAYSKCMRSNGVPSFPDPSSNGAFPNDGTIDRSSAQFKKAQEACKKLEVAGGPDQSAFQQGYKQLLKYSACMRSHGMPKFPDPVLEKDGVGISGDIDEGSPQFKSAHKACKSLQPGAGGS